MRGLFWFLLVCLQAAAAAAEPPFEGPAAVQDLNSVDFYLLTAGVGAGLHERFGHTGIRVRDPANGIDVVFNWGTFRFDEPAFALKFYRGALRYTMGIRSLRQEVAAFAHADRRLLQEQLHLTVSQKRRLYETIVWNARPENRLFAYQYWYKNCATIPRDHLDLAMSGELRRQTAQAMAGGRVFRDYVRRNLQKIPFVVPGLDIVMNAAIDRPITVWEEMFLPEKLREHLRAMPQVDDRGQAIAGTKLLGEPTVLVDGVEDLSAALPDYALIAAVGLLPLGVAGLAWARGRLKLARRALGWAGIAWGGLSALVGTALGLNWLASGHPDTWHNANLLLFFPIDWLYVVIGVALVRDGLRVKDRVFFVHAGRGLAGLHVAGAFGLLLLRGGGIVQQDVWRVIFYFGLPTLGLAVAYGLWAFAARPAALAATRGPEPHRTPEAGTAPSR